MPTGIRSGDPVPCNEYIMGSHRPHCFFFSFSHPTSLTVLNMSYIEELFSLKGKTAL